MKKFNQLTVRIAGLFKFVFLFVAIGCTENQLSTNEPLLKKNSTSPLERDNGISGKKLVNIDYTDNSFISFWEFENGEIGVRASHKIEENGQRSLANEMIQKVENLVRNKKSIVEVYKAVSPRPIEKEITLLNKAAERQAMFELNSPELQEGSKFEATDLTTRQTPNGISARQQYTCTPDLDNNNYASAWFRDTYCIEGNFRECILNQTWWIYVPSGAYGDPDGDRFIYSGWMKATAAAASYDAGTRFRSFRKGNSKPQFDYVINPRMVEQWVFTGRTNRNIWTDVTDVNNNFLPCSRAHLSVGWN